MEVIVASLTVPDLEAAASHPILGPLMDRGSHCPVEGVTDAAEILAAARAVAERTGLPLTVSETAEGTLCVIATDGARCLAVLSGPGLPVLGPIPACTLRDLESTWIALAGGTPAGGRHLLHEQAEEWDPRIERQLTQRLRQLYGE